MTEQDRPEPFPGAELPRPPLPAEDRAAPVDHVETTADGEVVATVVVADGGLSGRGRITVLRFGWHADEPLAVSLRLSAQPDHPALPRGRWTVLRDFLRYGLEQPTGDGAVRIGPDAGGSRLRLELRDDGRPAGVSVEQATVRAFLDRTEQDVPSGSERSDAAVDALLTRLLGADPGA